MTTFAQRGCCAFYTTASCSGHEESVLNNYPALLTDVDVGDVEVKP